MSHRRRWREGALVLAGALLLAAPAGFVWQALQPEPWTPRTLRVRFESVRYERAGMVFTYRLENRSRRSARLLPGGTTIRVMQPRDEPPLGYPVVRLPLQIEAYETQHVEVRLELAVIHDLLTPRESEEQTARVLRHKLPDVKDLDSPLSPLPMARIPASPVIPTPAPPAISPATLLANVLAAVNGFEVEDASHGIRIVFPRGW